MINNNTPVFSDHFNPKDLEKFWSDIKWLDLQGKVCVVFENKKDYEKYVQGCDRKIIHITDSTKLGRIEFIDYDFLED